MARSAAWWLEARRGVPVMGEGGRGGGSSTEMDDTQGSR